MLTRQQAAEFVSTPDSEEEYAALTDSESFLRTALDEIDSAIDALDTAQNHATNAALIIKIKELMLAIDAARAASPLWDVVDEQAREIKRASGRFEIGDDDGRPGSARLSYSSNL
jgi:hypothetical protein